MVVGASRSGTTLLDLMMGHRSAGFSCGEVAYVFRPRRSVQRQWRCRCGRDPCPVWKRFVTSDASRFHRSVVDGLQADLIADSSKSLSWLIDVHGWNRRAGLRTANVVIWKDPIDLAYSYWSRTSSPTAWRAAFVSYYGRFLELELPYTSVRYSDLVNDPARTIRGLCEALEVRYEPGQERYWEGEDHHHAFGSNAPFQNLGSKTPGIWTREPEPEFLDQWVNLAPVLSADEEVQHILRALAANDGSSCPFADGVTLRRPAWYFKDRGIGLFRRLIPT